MLLMCVKTLAILVFFCILAPCLFGGTITRGSIEFSGGFLPTGPFTLSGDNFSVSGWISSGNWQFGLGWCSGMPGSCDPGDSIGVGGYVGNMDVRGGSGTVDGITYPHLIWGSFNHPGPTYLQVTGDPITLDAGPGVYTGTFSFEGALCGILPGSSGYPEPCEVALRPLSGIGIVAMTFVEGEGGSLRYAGATHTFIPEPSTLVLTTAGLALVIAAARRRRLRRCK
jgi:hypothetical protein